MDNVCHISGPLQVYFCGTRCRYPMELQFCCNSDCKNRLLHTGKQEGLARFLNFFHLPLLALKYAEHSDMYQSVSSHTLCLAMWGNCSKGRKACKCCGDIGEGAASHNPGNTTYMC